MATLRRSHAPVPWGAQVEKTMWVRSRRGKPRQKRSDRPPLTHDPGWDWDGSRVLFSEMSAVSDGEESDCGAQVQLREDVCAYSTPLARTHTSLESLLDIARYQAIKRRGKARSGLDDFEVIRAPMVVPISEEVPGLGDIWMLGEWEKIDALSFKRTYSEVVQGFLDGKDPPNTPGCSQPAQRYPEDDLWECL